MSAALPVWLVSHRRLLGAAWAVLLTLCGCVIPPVEGVRVEAAEVVSQAPSPISPGRWAPGPWVELRLSTEDDLSRFRRVHGANVWDQVSLCREGRFDERLRLDGSGISDAARRGQIALSEEGINVSPDAGGRYTYFSYLALLTPGRSLRHIEGYALTAGHDLRRQADDLCLRFGGGTMLGPRHRSDTILIPYPLIAAALARAWPPHAALP